MKAMILAAGLGQRLRPLTQRLPKPLLQVGGQPLIAYHLQRLATAGVVEVVINVSYRADQIKAYCGDGRAWGLHIRYSEEPQPLGVLAGIKRALPWLQPDPFLTINADVYTDYALSSPWICLDDAVAHLLMVSAKDMPGDFDVSQGRLKINTAQRPYTFAGIACYQPALFDLVGQDYRTWLTQVSECGPISAEIYRGLWCDVGTPQRLAAINQLAFASGGSTTTT